MAQYFENFADEEIGAFPTNWTVMYGQSADWEIIRSVFNYGNRALEAESSGSRSQVIGHTLAGSVSGDCEIRARFSPASGVYQRMARVALRISGTDSDIDYYSFGCGADSTVVELNKVVNDSLTVLDTASIPAISTAGTYEFRFKIEGSTLYGKIWLTNVLEPDEWNIVYDDTSAPLTEGSIGLIGARYILRTIHFYTVGIGTAGDSAPNVSNMWDVPEPLEYEPRAIETVSTKILFQKSLDAANFPDATDTEVLFTAYDRDREWIIVLMPYDIYILGMDGDTIKHIDIDGLGVLYNPRAEKTLPIACGAYTAPYLIMGGTHTTAAPRGGSGLSCVNLETEVVLWHLLDDDLPGGGPNYYYSEGIRGLASYGESIFWLAQYNESNPFAMPSIFEPDNLVGRRGLTALFWDQMASDRGVVAIHYRYGALGRTNVWDLRTGKERIIYDGVSSYPYIAQQPSGHASPGGLAYSDFFGGFLINAYREGPHQHTLFGLYKNLFIREDIKDNQINYASEGSWSAEYNYDAEPDYIVEHFTSETSSFAESYPFKVHQNILIGQRGITNQRDLIFVDLRDGNTIDFIEMPGTWISALDLTVEEELLLGATNETFFAVNVEGIAPPPPPPPAECEVPLMPVNVEVTTEPKDEPYGFNGSCEVGIQTSDDGKTWSPFILTEDTDDIVYSLKKYIRYVLRFQVADSAAMPIVDEVDIYMDDYAREFTPYVKNLSGSRGNEARASQARVGFVSPKGSFDPLNIHSLCKGLLESNRVMRIFRGSDGLMLPAFYGLISRGNLQYDRPGESGTIMLLDRSKLFMRQKETTALYKGTEANDIVSHLFQTLGGLPSEDIELGDLDYEIFKVQFVDENIMDAGRIALAPKAYALGFDERGKLISRPPSPLDQSSWQFKGDKVTVINPEWDDSELVNRVIVYGRTEELYDVILQEQELVHVDGDVGLWRSSLTLTIWYSADQELRAKDIVIKSSAGEGTSNVRVGPVTYATIDSIRDKRCRVTIRNTHWLINSGGYGFYIFGKPYGQQAPGVIIGEAKDDDLIAEYEGKEIIKEIDDLPIFDYSTAVDLAEIELARAKLLGKKITVSTPYHPGIEVGDTVSVINPRTNTGHRFWVLGIRDEYQRGSSDSMTISGAVIANELFTEYGLDAFMFGKIKLTYDFGALLFGTVISQHEADAFIVSRMDLLHDMDARLTTGKLIARYGVEAVIGTAIVFETVTFTNCDATGRFGPTQEQVDAEYTDTPLDGEVTSLDGVQRWEVPCNSVFEITAHGAQGGTGSRDGVGGRGAKMSGWFELEQGDVLDIVVGQQGDVDGGENCPGGGGGTFVAKVTGEKEVARVVFNRRKEETSNYDQALIDLINSFEGTSVVNVIDDGDVSSYDFDNTSLLIVGAPDDDWEANHTAEATLAALDIPVISFCRGVSRNAFNMGAGSGATDVGSFTVVDEDHPISVALELDENDEIDLGSTVSTHRISDLESDTTLIMHCGTAGEAGLSEREQNDNIRIHFGYHRFDSGSEDLDDLFLAVLDYLDLSMYTMPTHELLLIAGGGGGYGVGTNTTHQAVADAHTEPYGKDGVGGNDQSDGGTDGDGGDGIGNRGAGGGGFYTDGGDGSNAGSGGHSFLRATARSYGGDGRGEGLAGFGGGGSVDGSTGWGAAGGGGGYSGGGAGYSSSNINEAAGGGGGSYNNGANQDNASGVSEEHGLVLIKDMGSWHRRYNVDALIVGKTPLWRSEDIQTAYSSSGTTLDVNKPTNLNEGDLIILFVTGRQTSITPPSGFALIRLEADTDSNLRPMAAAYYKIATDSEPETYTVTIGTSGYTRRLVIGRVTSFNASDPIDQDNGLDTGGDYGSSIDIPEITPTVSNTLLLAVAGIRVSSTVTIPAGMTEVFKNESDGYATAAGALEELETTSPTGIRTFSFSAFHRRAGLMFNIKPPE